MKNDTMRFFLCSIKLAENKEPAETFLPRHSNTFFFNTENKYKKKKIKKIKNKKHIKRKNGNNQL